MRKDPESTRKYDKRYQQRYRDSYRHDLKALADEDGVSMVEELRRLIARERFARLHAKSLNA